MPCRSHRDFPDPIRDERNGPFRVATWPPKRALNRAPGPRELVELHAFALQLCCQRVQNRGFIAPGTAWGCFRGLVLRR